MKPLGLDWIELGLDSVLYNPETKEIYTPNTNQTATVEGKADDGLTDGKNRSIIESRQAIKDPDTGKIVTNIPDRTDGYSYYPTLKKDKSGRNFTRPTVELPPNEYGYFIHGVNTYYDKRYVGKPAGIYYSEETGKSYFFENHGFDDYSVYDVG